MIATVLLIGFALAVAAAVIFWGTGIIRGQIDKTAGFAQGKLDCESQVEIDIGDARCKPGGGAVIVDVENLKSIALPNLRGRVVGENSQATSSIAGVALNGNEKKTIEFVYDTTKISMPKAIEVIPVWYSGNEQATCDSRKVAIEIDAGSC